VPGTFPKSGESPVGTTEISSGNAFKRPYGTRLFSLIFPALKCRATFNSFLRNEPKDSLLKSVILSLSKDPFGPSDRGRTELNLRLRSGKRMVAPHRRVCYETCRMNYSVNLGSQGFSGDWLPYVLLLWGPIWLLNLALVLRRSDYDAIT